MITAIDNYKMEMWKLSKTVSLYYELDSELDTNMRPVYLDTL